MNSVRSCRTLLSLAALAAALFLLPSTPIQADPVDDLLALKRVEHSHLIDCREPFEDAFPDESAVRMIEDGLLATQALKDLYGVSLTWQDLQADLDRMAADSKDPDRLRELFAALGNDPERLAEALVRPRLAPKRLRTAYYWDAGRHREARQLLETARQRLLQDAPLPEGVSHGMMPSGGSGPAARRGLRRSMPIVDPPSEIVETRDRFAFRRVHRDGEGRRKVEVFWTEKRSWFNWWKTARDAFAPAVPMEPDAAYRPPEITAADSHTWTATAVAPGDPECPDVRSRHTALWTGTEVVIWGGSNLSSGVFRSGGRYYPATDDWLTTNTDTESWCPLQREDHVAVWIGLYMLVWGGDDLITALDTGGVYRPLDDVWINCSHMDDSAPAARIAHEAVWTGDEMIVWGGADYDYITYYTEGGRYVIPDMNPVNFHWDTTPMSTTGAPSGRELFAWQYDTSNAEAIAWGGYYYDGGDTWYDDGAAYDSTTNSWSAIDDSTAPGRREVWSSAWTGDALAIWSGYDDASGFTPQDGGLYTPSPTDSWATITGTGAPSARSQHRTTWSDYEVVVWGGFDDLSGLYVNDGGRYSPEVDEWLDLPATGAPSERSEMSLLWLDDMLFIWGGYWWDDINELDVFYQDGALLVLPVATIGTVICGQTTVNAEAGWDGYQWSRDGVDIPGATGQSYDATEDGTYRCQVTDSVDGTISTNPLGIVILPLPEPVITGDDEMCENDPEVILDAGPFVTYQWHLDGGDISGATNQTYGAQPGVPGTYDYTVTVTNAQGCENTSPVHTLTVHPLPTVDAGGGEAECIDHAPWNLSGQTPTGGLWTGDGITDGALGTFDPATAGAGAHVITYTYTDPITGCVNSDTKTVTVWDLPAVEAGGDEEGCEDGSPWNLSGESPSGGTWAGPGIINASLGTFDPADPGAGVGVHVVTYTYTDTNGCVNSDAKNVTVHALPNVDAGGDEEGCLDDAPWNLSGESPSGGTWSGDGITDGFLGTFDPADPSAGVGAHLITYTYTDPITSCVNSDTKTVTVHDIPTVEAGGDEEACLNDVPFNLSGNSPAGGSWSGDGITNSALGTFDPATADVGAHTITYYYQDPATGCDDSDTKTVAVHPLPTPTITGESENTCPDEFVTLTTEAGMTSYQWNLDGGPIGGATGQAWDAVASGSYTVTVVDDNTCSATSAGHAVTIIDCCELPSGYGNNTASDLDPCADTGVQVSWDQDPAEWGDGGAGTRTYDVLRDAAPLQTGIAYGTTSWIDVTGSNGTSYDYSVRYNNGCGESAVTQGAAATDTASTAPSGLTNNTAADQDDCAAGVLVTWTADPADWGDNGIGTRTYDVLRDAAPVASGLVYGTTSWTDTTGVSGQAYTYTVRYNNGCGDSAATTGVSATDTFASDPSSLTNNGGTDRNGCADTGVQITWDADPGDWGDNGIGTRYYDVLRDGIVIIPNISYGTTARVDVTGTNEQDYLYQIRYRNGCGLTADTAGVTLTDSLGFAPSGLSNNAAADLDTCADTGVQVTWDADPADWGDSGSGTRFYHIQRDGGDIATFLTYGTTSYTDTTGVNDQVYTYTVVYRNGCGMTTATAPGADAADESGVAPSGLTNNTATDLDPCDATGVEIAWAQDPADWGDMGLGTRTYDVLRDGSPILTGIAYGTTSHTDTTGTGGQAYTYAVRYVNGCGNTADTPGVSGTDLVGATPSGLTNNGGTDRNGCGDTGVQITWDADPADWGDSGSGTRYYDILRDGIVIIPNVSYGTTARVDVTGTNEQAYLYQVRYKNGCGLTADTAGVSLTDSLGVAPSGLTNNGAIDVDGCASDGVLITWDADPADWGDSGSGTRFYHIQRDGGDIATFLTYGTTSYTDTTGVDGQIYTYTVVYRNGCGLTTSTAPGADASDEVGGFPSGLTNNAAADSDACADAGVDITWIQDPADWGDTGLGTRTYDVLRDGSPIVTGIAYGTTAYNDNTGTNGQAYTYAVRYVNGCGNTADTAGVSAADEAGAAPSGLTNNGGADRTGCGDTGVQITWDADPGDWGDSGIGTRYYDILRDGIVIIPNVSYGTTARVDVTGTNEQDYLYQVRYKNGCGLTADTAGVTLSDSLGVAPSGLNNNGAADLDPCADTGVQVTWDQDPADWGDSGSGTRFYNIQRDGIDIATLLAYGTTSYIDTTGVNDQVYTYTVVYRNGCGMTTATAPGADAADVPSCGGIPYPAPDGSGGTTPLTGTLQAAGAEILVEWDAVTCTAGEYNLIYGDLADVSTYTLQGAECAVGITGSHTWTGFPAADTYFLIVGTNGSTTESSWGTDSALAERNGATPSGLCGITAKDTTQTCP